MLKINHSNYYRYQKQKPGEKPIMKLTENIKSTIAFALFKGFDEAIEKCKPATDSKPMKDKIEQYFANDIMTYYISLIDAIEDNKLSDIEAVIKAQDITSNIQIHWSFYLPIGLHVAC